MSSVTVASSAYMGASDAFTWRMERDPALPSLRQRVIIGINVDTAAVPDPHVLLACLEESAAEITALGGA